MNTTYPKIETLPDDTDQINDLLSLGRYVVFTEVTETSVFNGNFIRVTRTLVNDFSNPDAAEVAATENQQMKVAYPKYYTDLPVIPF